MSFGSVKGGYKYAQGATFLEAEDQQAALNALADLTWEATIHPDVRFIAEKITRDCASRNDRCELTAVFNAVRYGDPEIPPLKNGVKYMNDPRLADYFESPVDRIRMCAKGACATDCDGHAALICALLGSIGWACGLRAWGPAGSKHYTHVYAVALFPKTGVEVYDRNGNMIGREFKEAIALDTTVPSFRVGSEARRGNVLNAYFDVGVGADDGKKRFWPADRRRRI